MGNTKSKKEAKAAMQRQIIDQLEQLKREQESQKEAVSKQKEEVRQHKEELIYRKKELEERKRREQNLREQLKAIEKEEEEKKMRTPWRTFEEAGDWSKEYEQRLIEELKTYKAHTKLMRANILFIGYVASGKTSFINSIASIDVGRIASPLIAGQTVSSMSFKLKKYVPTTNLRNFVLYDTMGVEKAEHAGFNVQDIVYLILGHVKPDYRFNPKTPISKADKDFIDRPCLEDKAHCVVFVVSSDAMVSRTIETEMEEKIEELQRHLREYEIPTVVVLTKIDVTTEDIAEDVKITYMNKTVKDAVEEAYRVFKVPRMHIFPVKNYSDETSIDPYKNILLLLALRKMLQLSSDHLTTTFTHSSVEKSGDTMVQLSSDHLTTTFTHSPGKISGDKCFQTDGRRFTEGEVGGKSASAEPSVLKGKQETGTQIERNEPSQIPCADPSNTVKVLAVVPQLDLVTKSFFSTLQKKLLSDNVELERVKNIQEANKTANLGRVVFLICGGHFLETDGIRMIKEVKDHKRLVLVNFHCDKDENNIIPVREKLLNRFKDIEYIVVMVFDRDSEETGIYDCDLNKKAVKDILERIKTSN